MNRAASYRAQVLVLVAALVASVALVTSGCGDRSVGQPLGDGGVDAALCDPEVFEDQDGDGIWDGYEDCAEGWDTDGDSIPDCYDVDSDNDGLSDSLETWGDALCGPPTDSEGDGLPDFRDDDSDNDGVFDGDEDRDHNGLVGNCGVFCPDLDVGQCGAGQACLATGQCEPPVTDVCADGETDPFNSDTDGDGLGDLHEPAMICMDARETYPLFRPWFGIIGIFENRLVLPEQFDSRSHTVAAPDLAMMTFEVDPWAMPTAGLLLMRPREGADVTAEATALVAALDGIPSAQILPIVDGSHHLSISGYDSIFGKRLEVTLAQPLDVATFRDLLLSRYSGIELAQIDNPGPELGVADTTFAVGLRISRRTTHSCDPGGPEIAVVVVAVAPLGAYNADARVRSSVDDLIDDSAMAGTFNDYKEKRCEAHLSTEIIELRHWAISQTVVVAVERSGPAGLYAEQLVRGAPTGFLWDSDAGHIQLIGQQALDPINVVVVSYESWSTTLLPCD